MNAWGELISGLSGILGVLLTVAIKLLSDIKKDTRKFHDHQLLQESINKSREAKLVEIDNQLEEQEKRLTKVEGKLEVINLKHEQQHSERLWERKT